MDLTKVTLGNKLCVIILSSQNSSVSLFLHIGSEQKGFFLYEALQVFCCYQKEDSSFHLAGLVVPYEFFELLGHFSAFMIPVAGAPRRQHASVF